MPSTIHCDGIMPFVPIKKYFELLLMSGLFVATTPALGASSFVVGSGEKYTTISEALSDMKDGDLCIVKSGLYRECLHITQNNIKIRGQGRVVITGCDPLENTQPSKINGQTALLFDVGQPVYEVFHGDHYLQLARFPNKEVPISSNEDWAFATIQNNGEVTFTENNLSVPQSLDDGYYVGMGNFRSWYSLTLPIVGVRENGNIQVDSSNASSGYMGLSGRGEGIGYIIGARAALDSPGEWYSNSSNVWIIPEAEGTRNYEFRTRLYGAIIKGSGVHLENIRFKAATARVDGNDVTFKLCSFEYISPFQHNPNPIDEPQNKEGQSLSSCWGTPDNGTAGVFVQGDGFIAENCRFSKSWWSGMMLRGNRARIENCLFEDVNWMAKRCAGLLNWGDDNVVRYSTFRNLGAAGIEGGNANWVQQYARRNIWEYDYIEDACKLVVDQGFFYVNHQRGDFPPAESVWRFNVGKTARGPQKGPWKPYVAAYYIDNNSSGYRVHNNIAIDVINPMKHNDTGDGAVASQGVWFYNNTFYNSGDTAFNEFGSSTTRDADLNVVNNLALSCSEGALPDEDVVKTLANNTVLTDETSVTAPASMDFTPTREDLQSGGIPVMGKEIPYIGAADPAKGMWHYGADESKLPSR